VFVAQIAESFPEYMYHIRIVFAKKLECHDFEQCYVFVAQIVESIDEISLLQMKR
jgi:hypothetical protein